MYLLLAKRAVTGMDPLSVTALMMVGATVLATPLLAIDGVKIAGHWDAVALGIVIAIVSSAFPYWLEMVAIRRVRAATYGVLLSIEPAIAALAALVVLGQRISPSRRRRWPPSWPPPPAPAGRPAAPPRRASTCPRPERPCRRPRPAVPPAIVGALAAARGRRAAPSSPLSGRGHTV